MVFLTVMMVFKNESLIQVSLPEGWTPASTYFCIDSGQILGVIRVRHGTSEYIHNVISPRLRDFTTSRGRVSYDHMLSWVQRSRTDQKRYYYL